MRDVLDRFDQGHRARGNLAEGADHLRMAGMADEHDVAAGLDQPLGLAVDLADQRAGGVEIVEAARLRRRPAPTLGTPWAEKTTGRPSGTSSSSLTNTAPMPAQPVDDEAVVDDFVPDIDRRPEPLDRQLDDLDGAVDARAKAARRRDQHVERGLGQAHAARCKASLAALLGASYERAALGSLRR